MDSGHVWNIYSALSNKYEKQYILLVFIIRTLCHLILIAWHADINRSDGIASSEQLTYTDQLPTGVEDNVNRASGRGKRDNFLSFYVLIFTAITNSNLALGTFFSHHNKRKVKQVQVTMVNANKFKYFLRMCHQ